MRCPRSTGRPEIAGAGATKAQYKTALNAFVDDIWTLYGAPVVIAPISLRTSAPNHADGTCPPSGAAFIVINTAQKEVIAENAHAYMGPSADDIEHESDCTHIYDNETWGERWVDAVQAAGFPPQCDDGIDNDGDGGIDWDGGPLAGMPDPQCVGNPWKNQEAEFSCGLGASLALVIPLLGFVASRRRRAS